MITLQLKTNEDSYVNSNEYTYFAFDNGDEVGQCHFSFDDGYLVIEDLKTTPYNFSIGDGLVRAGMKYAMDRTAKYVKVKDNKELTAVFSGVKMQNDNTAYIEDILSGSCSACE